MEWLLEVDTGGRISQLAEKLALLLFLNVPRSSRPAPPVDINFTIVNQTSVMLNWARPIYACDISYYIISAMPGLAVNVPVKSTQTYYYLAVNNTAEYYPMVRAQDSAGRIGYPANATGRCFALVGEYAMERPVHEAVYYDTDCSPTVPPPVMISLSDVSFTYPMAGYATVTVSWTVSWLSICFDIHHAQQCKIIIIIVC